MSKIFNQQFQGAGLPTTYYKQTVGFAVQQVQIWNNSPITYTIKDTPSGLPYVIVPPFFSMSMNLPGFGGFALVGDATLPFTTSTLVLQLLDEATGSPFGGEFGSSAWGAGSVPNVLTNVNPGDQILAWQIQQLVNALSGVMTGQNYHFIIPSPSGSFLVDDAAGNRLIQIAEAPFPAPSIFEFRTLQVLISAGARINVELISTGPVRIDEQAAPATPLGSGRLYVTLAGALHYLGPSGTDTALAPA